MINLVTGICWQTERIKKRKEIKRQKQTALAADSAEVEATPKRKEAPTSDDEGQPPRKFAKREGHSFGKASNGARKTEKGVISSLFRHNPDIPAVKRLVFLTKLLSLVVCMWSLLLLTETISVSLFSSAL